MLHHRPSIVGNFLRSEGQEAIVRQRREATIHLGVFAGGWELGHEDNDQWRGWEIAIGEWMPSPRLAPIVLCYCPIASAQLSWLRVVKVGSGTLTFIYYFPSHALVTEYGRVLGLFPNTKVGEGGGWWTSNIFLLPVKTIHSAHLAMPWKGSHDWIANGSCGHMAWELGLVSLNSNTEVLIYCKPNCLNGDNITVFCTKQQHFQLRCLEFWAISFVLIYKIKSCNNSTIN